MDRVYRGPTMPKKRKRKLLTWKMLWVLVVFIIAIYIALYFLVVPEREDQPFFASDDRPLVIAHRGGAEIAPENTLVAFNKAQNLGVDVIEFDVQITSDGHLVVIHDPVVDNVTDGKGYVHRMTLAELKELDAAYYFTDVRGNAIYRGQGVTIPTVEEVFKAFPDERFNIEMKVYDAAELEDDAEAEEGHNEAQNDADGQSADSKQTEEGAINQEEGQTDGEQSDLDADGDGDAETETGTGDELLPVEKYNAARVLWELIEEYDMQDQVLVSSFSEPFMQQFNAYSRGSVAVSAPLPEAQRFTFYHKLFLNRLYRPESDVLQLPVEYGLFNLKDRRLIEGAHRLNMYIHYWTINDEEEMLDLLERGADAIITDRPDLLIRVMNEMDDWNVEEDEADDEQENDEELKRE